MAFNPTSKATIGNNSNNNVILQNSNVTQNNTYMSSSAEMVQLLGQTGQYDAIQQFASGFISSVSSIHPLYPDYSAKYDYDLSKLVSTPETSEALEKYPLKIKGTFEIDYDKYPHMDKSETPWEYTYRTQSQIELLTTSYQEYLGDMEDPFPKHTYSEGMVTVIKAPEFPEAQEAHLISGDINLPFLFRRKPCMEYGRKKFGNYSNNLGFDIDFIVDENPSNTSILIKKTHPADWETQLLRERLLCNIGFTKKLTVTIEGHTIIEAVLENSECQQVIFQAAPSICEYISNLITIEKHLHCSFDTTTNRILIEDINIARLIANSLEKEFTITKKTFDNEIRLDYDQIPEKVLQGVEQSHAFHMSIFGMKIKLQGIELSVGKYSIEYIDAKINNIKTVRKRVQNKHSDILMTVKPCAGKSHFIIREYMDEIRVLDN